jgi:membrane protease YdiL (CAAX protease family)
VTYTADILVFVAITFVFALIWGYLTQKTGALWGSALFHAGADTLIIIGIFAGKKT